MDNGPVASSLCLVTRHGSGLLKAVEESLAQLIPGLEVGVALFGEAG